MQIIRCECGAELPFQERDLSAAAGKPFTCPICGMTRKLPLANVFAPAGTSADPTVSRSPLLPSRSTRLRQIEIGAATGMFLLLLLAGPEQALRVTGFLIAGATTALLLVHAARRDPPKTMVSLAVALLGGIPLCYPHWSSTAGLAAAVIGIIFQQVLKDRRARQPEGEASDHWRLDLGKNQSP